MSRVQETVVTYDSMVQHCGDEPGAYVPVSWTGYVPVSGMPISDESFDGMQDDDFFAEEDDMSRRTSPFSYSSLSGRTTRARRTGSVPFHVGQRITDWVPSSDDDECSGILSAFLAAPKKLHARSTVNTLLGSLYVNLMGGEPSIYSTKASFSKWWLTLNFLLKFILFFLSVFSAGHQTKCNLFNYYYHIFSIYLLELFLIRYRPHLISLDI